MLAEISDLLADFSPREELTIPMKNAESNQQEAR
jgi:hypothetical protein